MFKTEGGMFVGEELITDLSLVIDKITQPTTPVAWHTQFVSKLPKFKAREWSNKRLLDYAIDSIYSSCQEYCVGQCHCGQIATLMKRRFKNV